MNLKMTNGRAKLLGSDVWGPDAMRTFVAILFYCLLMPVLAAAETVLSGPKKVALVIGNAAYAHEGELKNPANDAQLIGSTLKSQGFDAF